MSIAHAIHGAVIVIVVFQQINKVMSVFALDRGLSVQTRHAGDAPLKSCEIYTWKTVNFRFGLRTAFSPRRR